MLSIQQKPSLSALSPASSIASARFSTAASRALTMCEPLCRRLHDALQTLPVLAQSQVEPYRP